MYALIQFLIFLLVFLVAFLIGLAFGRKHNWFLCEWFPSARTGETETEVSPSLSALKEAKPAYQTAASASSVEKVKATVEEIEEETAPILDTSIEDLKRSQAKIRQSIVKPEEDTAPPKKATPKKKAASKKKAGSRKTTRKKAASKKTTSKKTAARKKFKVDDLTMINGIGPVYARDLKKKGITSLEQIANWKKADVNEWVERLGPLGDRIIREEWQKQAKALMKELG